MVYTSTQEIQEITNTCICHIVISSVVGLAIPLLIQQIIDKVLSQGNLSSLNVLGTAMIVMALF